MKEISNRSATFNFFVEQKYEAGIILTGTEIKSIRKGQASFNDSFCLIHQNEVILRSLHIAEYSHGTSNNHNPTQDRKLLLHRKEIKKIVTKMKERGYTLIPLRIYFSESGYAKIEIALAKGKKLYDKRETIKKREEDRQLREIK